MEIEGYDYYLSQTGRNCKSPPAVRGGSMVRRRQRACSRGMSEREQARWPTKSRIIGNALQTGGVTCSISMRKARSGAQIGAHRHKAVRDNWSQIGQSAARSVAGIASASTAAREKNPKRPSSMVGAGLRWVCGSGRETSASALRLHRLSRRRYRRGAYRRW